MMKKTLVVIILVCMLTIGMTGIISGIGVIEPIIKDKEIPDAKYQDLKIVFEKEGVVIDDKIGLDVNWEEKSCENNYVEDLKTKKIVLIGETCQYALYKKNLFSGAIIKVVYLVEDSSIQRQVKLDKVIEDKIDFVKSVFEKRQLRVQEEKQKGQTNFVSNIEK